MTNGDVRRAAAAAAYLEEKCAELRALARQHGFTDAARYLHAGERVAALEARRGASAAKPMLRCAPPARAR